MKLTPIQKTCFTFNFPNIVQGPGRSFWLIVFLSLLSFHFPVQDAAAQTGQTPVKVTGTVTDHAGEPLPGVSSHKRNDNRNHYRRQRQLYAAIRT